MTGFTRAVFSPGDEVELHWHKSKDEVFFAAEGKGVIEVDGTVVQVGGRLDLVSVSIPASGGGAAPAAVAAAVAAAAEAAVA